MDRVVRSVSARCLTSPCRPTGRRLAQSGLRTQIGFVQLGLVLGAVLLVLAGCHSAPKATSPAADGGVDSIGATTDEFRPAAAGTPSPLPQQDEADRLLREMELQGQERVAASRAATDAAQKLINDLRYLDAEGRLQEALRLDPNNEIARGLLDQVHFVLGDRSGEIRDFTREELERERVRRSQAKVELQRLYRDGLLKAEAGEFEAATRIFDRVLEQIEWFYFNEDLSSLKTEAEAQRQSADARAKQKAMEDRRRQEAAAAESKDAEASRSLQFLQNRVRNMIERVHRAFENNRYEEAIRLCEQILDADRGNPEASRLLRRAKELRHLHEVTRVAHRTQQEWERSFLNVYEAQVPYQDIFNFPSADRWNSISRKVLSVEDRFLGTETSASRDIKARLATEKLTIEFPGVPLEEVLDTLQSISGINFVLTAEARQALEDSDDPVRLSEVRDLPLENILRLVLHGRDPRFSYVVKNSAVVVGPSESVRDDIYLEFYEVQDITKRPPDFKAPQLALDENEGGDGGGSGGILNFGDDGDAASDPTVPIDVVVDLITKTLWADDGPPEGESADGEGGKLVVRTTVSNHRKVERLLEQLRKGTGMMVTVETRFVDLQDNFLQSIGIDFGSPFTSNLPNPINDIDGNGTQISPGYEWVDPQGQFDLRGASFNSFSLPLGSSVAPFQISDRGGFALQYNVLDVYVLEAILEANAKTQELRALDAPRVTAFNTQTAHSLVIDQSAYIKDAEVNQTGVIPVINPVIGVLNAGSILEIRPTVSYDRKYVVLEIQPTLAVRLPSRFRRLTLGLTNLEVEFPVLSVTKIKTTVTVPDGGTVLVGGLKRTITQDQDVGIPIINRIPFLNLLFGRKGQSQLQSNLFVLINAKITIVRDEERKRFN